jgi:hypothetical protein
MNTLRAVQRAACSLGIHDNVEYIDQVLLPELIGAVVERRRPPAEEGASEWRVNFDGWELVVRGHYRPPAGADKARFDVTAAYHPDSAVDVKDLFDDLATFMVVHIECQIEEAHLEDAA